VPTAISFSGRFFEDGFSAKSRIGRRQEKIAESYGQVVIAWQDEAKSIKAGLMEKF